MRKEETSAQEEWFFVRLLKLFHSPARQLPVAFVFVAVRKRAPVHQRMVTRRFNQR